MLEEPEPEPATTASLEEPVPEPAPTASLEEPEPETEPEPATLASLEELANTASLEVTFRITFIFICKNI